MNAATTVQQRQAELRHDGVRVALGLLHKGHPGDAFNVLLSSVHQQARLDGVRCDSLLTHARVGWRG